MLLKIIKIVLYNYGRLLNILCDIFLKINNFCMSLSLHLLFGDVHSNFFLKNNKYRYYNTKLHPIEYTSRDNILCIGKTNLSSDTKPWSKSIAELHSKKIIYDFCSDDATIDTVTRLVMCTHKKLLPESIFIVLPDIFSEEIYCKKNLKPVSHFYRVHNNRDTYDKHSTVIIDEKDTQQIIYKALSNLHYIDSVCTLYNINLHWVTTSNITDIITKNNFTHLLNFKTANIPIKIPRVASCKDIVDGLQYKDI
jgi:hypothetical protein